ncbi:protein vac14 homolog [Plakobranchus ocellatus]|uniref:Protein VAC14 homolog n=1 Tax=Plakobranchus ocellatus TaxID=259542 RepID=A0AAV4B888_9GAST|nr:protein vac14 homolog [Plakobranchus ocellatus]
MVDRECAPLTASCVRALVDKLYEKRKSAALEIERIVKDLISANQFDQIKKLLKVLEEFASSQNPNTRKGGLIGLAAVAIGLGKVAREAILPHFNEVFEGLSKLTAHPDQNVKNGAELLDRLIKILGDNSNEIRKMCQNVLAEFLEVREAAEGLNQALRKLVEAQDDQPTPTVGNISLQTHIYSSSPTASEADAAKNSSAMIQLEIPSVIKVLQRLLGHETIQTRVAALKWFNLLLVKTPNKIFRHIDDFFDLLMTTLADPSDDVVLLDLEVLSQISSNPAGFGLPDNKTVHPPSQEKSSGSDKSAGELKLNPFFTRLMNGLVDWFKKDKQLLEDRGAFIIRQLSIYLSAEALFRSLAEILTEESDVTMSSEILSVKKLLDIHDSGELEATVDFLKEIDKLVQLIESPIFAYLRLQLLEANDNPELIKVCMAY